MSHSLIAKSVSELGGATFVAGYEHYRNNASIIIKSQMKMLSPHFNSFEDTIIALKKTLKDTYEIDTNEDSTFETKNNNLFYSTLTMPYLLMIIEVAKMDSLGKDYFITTEIGIQLQDIYNTN